MGLWSVVSKAIGKVAPVLGPIGQAIGIGSTLYDMTKGSGTSSSSSWSKNLAMNQLQYRVADAKAAGLHPLAALGISPQPSSSAYVGDRMSQMGQNLGRLTSLIETQSEKKHRALENRILELQGDRLELENKGLIKGQQDQIDGIQLMPSKITKSPVGQPHVTRGVKPMYDFDITLDNYAYPVYSQDIADAVESDWSANFELAMKKILVRFHIMTPRQKVRRQEYREYQKMLMPKYMPEGYNHEDYQWRLDTRNGLFKLVKRAYPGEDYFFLDKKYGWPQSLYVPKKSGKLPANSKKKGIDRRWPFGLNNGSLYYVP